jgi:hypothetical protein
LKRRKVINKTNNVYQMPVENIIHSRRIMTAVVLLELLGVLLASFKAFKRMDVRSTVIDTSAHAALLWKTLE